MSETKAIQRIPDEAVERAARAQYEHRGAQALGRGMNVTIDWEAGPEATRDLYRKDARVALEASGAVFLTDAEKFQVGTVLDWVRLYPIEWNSDELRSVREKLS